MFSLFKKKKKCIDCEDKVKSVDSYGRCDYCAMIQKEMDKATSDVNRYFERHRKRFEYIKKISAPHYDDPRIVFQDPIIYTPPQGDSHFVDNTSHDHGGGGHFGGGGSSDSWSGDSDSSSDSSSSDSSSD